MSRRLLFRLFLAAVLAFAGGAVQLHALGHAQHDLEAAGQGHKAPPPLEHSTEQCLVVHALDGAAVETDTVLSVEKVSQHVSLPPSDRAGESPAIAFRSRAPPVRA